MNELIVEVESFSDNGTHCSYMDDDKQCIAKPYITESIREFKKMVESAENLIETITSDLKDIINFDVNYDHNLHVAQHNKRKRIRNRYVKRLLK